MLPVLALLALSHTGPEVRTEARGLGVRHALHRADVIANVRYELGLSIDATAPELIGTSVIHFTMVRPAPITVDFDGGTVVGLIANGETVEPSYGGRYLPIAADRLQAGENVLSIDFRHPYSSDGAGLTRWRDPEDGRIYLFTDFEPYLANTLFPCFDQPDLKATYRITVEAPAAWSVITAAREHEILDAGDRRRWIFEETERFSTYLFSLHAGDYQVWEAQAGDIPLRLFARRALARYVDADAWFDVTRRGLAFYGELFGVPYPFGKYDQVVPPAMNYEAMENVGAVTFSEDFIFRRTPTADDLEGRARVILHEMAHMWFGDLVTMRWWDDLWLNESFATYLSAIAMDEALHSERAWLDFDAESKAWAYREDQLATTHPIEADVKNTEDAFGNFDGITYGKGASALSQIAFAVSEEKFREAVRRYFSRHAFANADRRDFVEALEETAGVPLERWTDEWLDTPGLNAVRPELACKDDRVESLDLVQSAPDRFPTLRTHRTRIALFEDLDHPDVIDATYSGARTRIDAAAGKPCPQIVLVNYADRDYAKLILDDRTLASVRRNLSRLREPMVRALIWQALYEMVRDARLAPADYLTLVKAHLPLETELVVLRAVLGTIDGGSDDTGALVAYLSLESDLPDLSAFLRARTIAAPAGSEIQLAWFDAWVATASERKVGLELARLVEGRVQIAGVTLDQRSPLGGPGARVGPGSAGHRLGRARAQAQSLRHRPSRAAGGGGVRAHAGLEAPLAGEIAGASDGRRHRRHRQSLPLRPGRAPRAGARRLVLRRARCAGEDQGQRVPQPLHGAPTLHLLGEERDPDGGEADEERPARAADAAAGQRAGGGSAVRDDPLAEREGHGAVR